MNDIESIRKRMKQRKGVNKPLNDKNFKNVYNGMIKSMVVLLIGIGVVTYTKIYPDNDLKAWILNDANFKSATSWISNNVFGFLPKQEDLTVNKTVLYTRVDDSHFKSASNEVVNFEKGKVVYTGSDATMGAYVVVLFENDVQVTYSGLQDVFVSLYDTVDEGMVLGTYESKFILLFERLGKEMSYETYIGME